MRGCERDDYRVKPRRPNIRKGTGDVRRNPQPKGRAEIVRVPVVKSNFVEVHLAIMVDDFQRSWSRLEGLSFGHCSRYIRNIIPGHNSFSQRSRRFWKISIVCCVRRSEISATAPESFSPSSCATSFMMDSSLAQAIN
jgi:hypothetical protein